MYVCVLIQFCLYYRIKCASLDSEPVHDFDRLAVCGPRFWPEVVPAWALG